MKRLFLIAVISFAATLSSFAQSTIIFANDGTTLLRLCTGTALPAGNAYNVELLYAPQGTPDIAFDDAAPTAIRIGPAVGIAPLPGYFNGGARTSPATTY